MAQTVSHGIHGRRRAGSGETFWQFRQFEQSDSAMTIDWRRSAGSDHLFVREREWEAAHSIWIWLDMSPSMHFCSHLCGHTKLERAIVLTLAIADLLTRGGERVGLLGGRLLSGRGAVPRLAEAIAQNLQSNRSAHNIPPDVEISRFSECILLSDFLSDDTELSIRLDNLAGQGVLGHLVQVLDPAEETLPYEGHTEFVASEGGDKVVTGRAETLRALYQDRMQSHRRALQSMARRLQWSFLLHHSDRPPEQALLALHNRMAGYESDYRYRASSQPLAIRSNESATRP